MGTAAAVAGPAAADTARPNYIVMLTADPVATYAGGVDGLAATAPAAGQKLDSGTTQVQAYRSYLDRVRAAVRSAAPGAKLLYDFDFTVAGFSARLTAGEAAALGRRAEVAQAGLTGQHTDSGGRGPTRSAGPAVMLLAVVTRRAWPRR